MQTIRYCVEKQGDIFSVVSKTYNTDWGGKNREYTNFVASFATEQDAKELVEKLKNWSE